MSLDTSTSALHLNLPHSGASQTRAPTSITVHPSVVASILTHHTRRNASHRVIGTLLGLRSETGAEIEVRTAFAVPHSENESQCAVDMAFQQGMADLLARGQGGKGEGKEVVVGWYASHPTLNTYSALIQNYFQQETSPFPAVHLTVDTELEGGSSSGLGVKGWVSAQLGINPKPDSCVFLPVPVNLKYSTEERAGLDLLTASTQSANPSLPPLHTLSTSLTSLSELLEQVESYVSRVASGEIEGDAEVGRYLLDNVGRWADASEGGDEVKKGLQDTLTVSYLASLVRSQAELAGRLNLLQQA